MIYAVVSSAKIEKEEKNFRIGRSLVEKNVMIDLDNLFRYKILNPKKLLDYGFIQHEDLYVKEIPIMNKQFHIRVTVQSDGTIGYKVIETAIDEEYILVHVPGATGGFVGEVRSACEKVLADNVQENDKFSF